MNGRKKKQSFLIDAVARGNSIRSYDDELLISDGRFVGLDYDHNISDKEYMNFFVSGVLKQALNKKKKSFVCHSLL